MFVKMEELLKAMNILIELARENYKNMHEIKNYIIQQNIRLLYKDFKDLIDKYNVRYILECNMSPCGNSIIEITFYFTDETLYEYNGNDKEHHFQNLFSQLIDKFIEIIKPHSNDFIDLIKYKFLDSVYDIETITQNVELYIHGKNECCIHDKKRNIFVNRYINLDNTNEYHE